MSGVGDGIDSPPESFLAARPHRVGFSGMGDWVHAGHHARVEARRAELLFFGDRTGKVGLRPLVFEAVLGRPASNLAVTGGPPAASYYLLARALDAGARPEAVVVDFPPTCSRSSPPSTPSSGRAC